MNNMKQGLRLLLPVQFIGIDLDTVSSIEFVFKQRCKQTDIALKSCTWMLDGSGTGTRDGDTIYIPWSLDETYDFKPDDYLYMDTRIFPTGSVYQPVTNIVKIPMDLTLFQEEEE